MTEPLLENIEKGIVIVLSAPAGTGKTTLAKMLVKEFPNQVTQSISCTTRQPRKGEVDGKDYIFLQEEAFNERVKRGEFLEHAEVFGQQYGTLKETVTRIQESGRHALLVIDTQGAMALKGKLNATFVFIAPPSIETLKERLCKRDTETEELIEERIGWAQKEIEAAENYDYQIVNDDLETAYQTLRNILIAEGNRLGKKEK